MPPKSATAIQRSVYKDMGHSELSFCKEVSKNDNVINRRKAGRVDGKKLQNEPTRQNHLQAKLVHFSCVIARCWGKRQQDCSKVRLACQTLCDV